MPRTLQRARVEAHSDNSQLPDELPRTRAGRLPRGDVTRMRDLVPDRRREAGRPTAHTLLRAAAAFALAAAALLAGAPGQAAAACPNAALTGASPAAPDCRAYEQVSPTEKGGFAAYPDQGLQAQTTASGEALGYLSYSAFPGAPGNTALYAGHLAARTPGGWNTTDLTPPFPKGQIVTPYLVGYGFSEDLSQSVVQVPLAPLAEGATPGAYNLFRRQPNPADPSKPVYSLVNNAKPTVSQQELCPPASGLAPLCFLAFNKVAYAGASRDFSHILFESESQLTPEAPGGLIENIYENTIHNLYESTEGKVRLVGILPKGEVAAASTEGSGSSTEYLSNEQEKDGRVEHAISEDGSRIFWTDPTTGNLYVREDGSQPDATTVLIAEGGQFWDAATDGSIVYYTKAGDLYRYEFASETKPAAVTTDLTPGAEVQGVVGASNDGSYVYLVAHAQLVPSKGVQGQPNLYIIHDGGSPVYVATLSGGGECKFVSEQSADACIWSPHSVVSAEAYITPDGRHLGFMSTMRLPTINFPAGYDNIDQRNGEADSEVFEYSAPTPAEEGGGGSGLLLCASCQASGEPPVSSSLIGGIAQTQEHGAGLKFYESVSSPFYKVRALNENGTRLFYTASAPHASPYRRVYEYEADGEGGCATAAGCQFLLSSVGGGQAEEFLGASASGNDAFFATAARLAPGDVDNLPDVYDARVNGGFPPAQSETICENDCAHPAPAPAPSPVSSSTTGPSGNLPPPPTPKTSTIVKRKCAKGRHLSRGRCVKTKHKARKANANIGRRP